MKRPVEESYGCIVVATHRTDGALPFVADLLPVTELHLVQVVEISAQLKEAM